MTTPYSVAITFNPVAQSYTLTDTGGTSGGAAMVSAAAGPQVPANGGLGAGTTSTTLVTLPAGAVPTLVGQSGVPDATVIEPRPGGVLLCKLPAATVPAVAILVNFKV